ncbi:unnamed protein product [Citrullus colocynthis]|uniref:Uncharacterized protein n=1 Tax=Citrullus colocynthis TaxID=252529 RepID=A0ABP0YX75_9ROSI
MDEGCVNEERTKERIWLCQQLYKGNPHGAESIGCSVCSQISAHGSKLLIFPFISVSGALRLQTLLLLPAHFRNSAEIIITTHLGISSNLSNLLVLPKHGPEFLLLGLYLIFDRFRLYLIQW